MSVQLAQVNNEVGLIGNEISISGYAIRNLISVDTSDTANFIKVKLEAGFDVLGEDDGTQLSFSITTRFPKIKGLDGISERLSALEREVESLRTQTRNNEGDENYENYEKPENTKNIINQTEALPLKIPTEFQNFEEYSIDNESKLKISFNDKLVSFAVTKSSLPSKDYQVILSLEQ